MPILRTPDERFQDLPGYDFVPHYLAVPDPRCGPLRMLYLDAGPPDGPVAVSSTPVADRVRTFAGRCRAL